MKTVSLIFTIGLLLLFSGCTNKNESHFQEILNNTRKDALGHFNSNNWLRMDSISVIEFISLLPVQEHLSNKMHILTTIGQVKADWINEQDLEILMEYIDSENPSHCVVQAISSQSPIGEESTVGGQIINIINSYRRKEPYPNFLTLCAETNEARIEEVKKWWKNRD
ncbi:MAG: hypothetical protein AAF806_31205 [Bacteroidota bacterium]